MSSDSKPVPKKDPYTGDVGYVYTGKTKRGETKGQLVVVLGVVSDKRGLDLIAQRSRVLCKNEIHEMITTDEADVVPGNRVDSVAVIGFFEVTQGGVIVVGQPVYFNGKEMGTIAGFDETHFPNHYNVVVYAPKKFTGLEAGLELGDTVSIGTRP